MKSLALFAENLYGGGVEKVLQTLLMHIDKNCYTVTLYSNRQEMLNGVFPQDIEYKYLFETSGNEDSFFVVFFKKLINKFKLLVYYHFSPDVFYKLFVRKHYDVAIAFIEGYATRIVSGAPENMKKLAWVHTDLENYHWTSVAYRNPEEEKECYQKFDKVVCVSHRIEEVMRLMFHLEGKTICLYNPIDREEIRTLSMCDLSDEFRKGERLRVVTIGSLIPVKGYERLLRCAKRLLQEGYDFELFIVGEGGLREQFVKYIQTYGMEGKVFLTGFLDNPYNLLATADIYVCSSLAEGLNTAITEALILGRAVLSTECSGISELLGDSKYGLVVLNDEDSLMEGLRSLLSDSNLRDSFSEAAKIKGSNFSIECPLSAIYELLN